jgi:hypothetical protein
MDHEEWHLPHMRNQPNDSGADMTILFNESVFPRASRDNCLRHSDPVQGPYINDSRLGKVIWVVLCLLSFAAIGVLLAIRG